MENKQDKGMDIGSGGATLMNFPLPSSLSCIIESQSQKCLWISPVFLLHKVHPTKPLSPSLSLSFSPHPRSMNIPLSKSIAQELFSLWDLLAPSPTLSCLPTELVMICCALLCYSCFHSATHASLTNQNANSKKLRKCLSFSKSIFRKAIQQDE